MTTYIVGVDCATQPENVGLALAEVDNNICHIVEARCCSKRDKPVDVVSKWCHNHPVSLLALDAPLGWPREMGTQLSMHNAGDNISSDPNQLFRRYTDHEIECRLRKRPLEVGADRIARTALSALKFLDELRDLTDEVIPLAWKMKIPAQLSAIEVYPVATWLTLNDSDVKYSAAKSGELKLTTIRQKVAQLNSDVDSVVQRAACPKSKTGHILDAILCILAAVEFIGGRCCPPDNSALAEKEGWIWAGPSAKSD